MRKVLFIAYSYPPVNEPAALRVAGFVRHLPAFGWEPVVLTAAGGVGRGYGAEPPPLAEEWRVPEPDPVKRLLRRAQGAGAGAEARRPGASLRSVLHSRVGQSLRSVYTGLLWPDRDAPWAALAGRVALHRLLDRPDIAAIVSSASGCSMHALGAWLKRRTGLPWVEVCHDPWAGDSPQERPRSRLRVWMERHLEAANHRLADRVVTVGADYVPLLCCEHHRVEVIRGGFEPADFADLPPAPPPRPFRIAFAGSTYGGLCDPVPLLKALRLLLNGGLFPEGGEVLFIGPEEPTVMAAAQRLGLSRVVRHTGYRPHREALRLVAESHVAVVLPTPRGYQIPSKVYEYVGLGRPILAIWPPQTDLGRLLETTGAGRVCPPDRVDLIAGALCDLLQAWGDGSALPRSCPVALSRFTRRAMAERLAAILHEVAV